MANPTPTPTALKLLKGNPGKRPLPKYEPLLPLELPVAPSFLTKEAKREWNRMVVVLFNTGLITVGDTATFQAYCQAYGHWVAIEKQFTNEGSKYTLMNDKGNTYMNPLLTALNQAAERLAKCCQEFGLTPAARTKVMVFPTDPEANAKTDPAKKYFKP